MYALEQGGSGLEGGTTGSARSVVVTVAALHYLVSEYPNHLPLLIFPFACSTCFTSHVFAAVLFIKVV
jgi:hypothetical protein